MIYKFYFKYLISLVLIFWNLNFVSAQESTVFRSKIKLNSYSKIKSKKEPPIQIGLDFGVPLKILGENFFTSGIFGYLNINLKNRDVFLKIEYGNLWLNKELIGNTSTYAALSITGQIFRVNKTSKIYVDFGYGFFSNNDYYGGGIKLAVTYIYSFSNLISFNTSIKFPLIREARNNQFYYNPFLTLGVQFF